MTFWSCDLAAQASFPAREGCTRRKRRKQQWQAGGQGHNLWSVPCANQETSGVDVRKGLIKRSAGACSRRVGENDLRWRPISTLPLDRQGVRKSQGIDESEYAKFGVRRARHKERQLGRCRSQAVCADIEYFAVAWVEHCVRIVRAVQCKRPVGDIGAVQPGPQTVQFNEAGHVHVACTVSGTGTRYIDVVDVCSDGRGPQQGHYGAIDNVAPWFPQKVCFQMNRSASCDPNHSWHVQHALRRRLSVNEKPTGSPMEGSVVICEANI